MLNRREMLSGLAMGTLATLTPGCLTAKRDGERRTIRIAHCGDPQFGFSDPKDAAASYAADLARFERLIDDVNEWRPDLCFLAGDMTHRAVDLERDWPRLLKRFRVPVVATAGNHDMGQNLTRENVERFERVTGDEFAYVFKIVFAETNGIGLAAAQRVKRELRSSVEEDYRAACPDARGESVQIDFPEFSMKGNVVEGRAEILVLLLHLGNPAGYLVY